MAKKPRSARLFDPNAARQPSRAEYRFSLRKQTAKNVVQSSKTGKIVSVFIITITSFLFHSSKQLIALLVLIALLLIVQLYYNILSQVCQVLFKKFPFFPAEGGEKRAISAPVSPAFGGENPPDRKRFNKNSKATSKINLKFVENTQRKITAFTPNCSIIKGVPIK